MWVWCVEWIFCFSLFFFYIYMSSLFFITVHNDFGKGLQHFCARSAFYMGKLSPTGPCFKSPIVLCFLCVWYTASGCKAGRQHYFGLNPRALNHTFKFLWICHQSQSSVCHGYEFVNSHSACHGYLHHLLSFWQMFFYHHSSRIWNGQLCDHSVFSLLCMIVFREVI